MPPRRNVRRRNSGELWSLPTYCLRAGKRNHCYRGGGGATAIEKKDEVTAVRNTEETQETHQLALGGYPIVAEQTVAMVEKPKVSRGMSFGGEVVTNRCCPGRVRGAGGNCGDII